MAEYSVVGKSLPRVEGPAKATGASRFTGDMSLPRQLYGRALGSPHAHARILAIDTRRAERLAGIKAIITGNDTGGRKYGHTPDMADQYPLAVGKVRFIGEPVAALAAVDEDTAQEALEMISVEYEELPTVFDPWEAMRPGAPQVHDVEFNVSRTFKEHFGDVDRGFRDSFYQRTDIFTTQPLAVCAMEPHASMASFGTEGNLTVWASTQSPFRLRRYLSGVLGLEEDLVRVIKPTVGGGFCGKTGLFSTDFCSALLSMRTGRPVKMTLNREEVFTTCGGRMPMAIELKAGVKRDGRLVAMEAKVTADNGAYNRGSATPMILAGSLMHLPYRLPNVRYTGYLVYTNNPPTAVQRGAGNPQIRFAIEVQLDSIAEELGLDPMDVRRLNALHPGDVTANRFQIRSCALDECIEQACGRHRWKERRGRLGEGQGIGLACGDHSVSSRNGPHDSSQALVKLDHNGTATVLTGAADIGQGSDTTLCQIAAEELGLHLNKVHIIAADTALTPVDLGTFGSRVTVISGNAVKAAAEDARCQLFDTVADRLEARIEDLEARDGRVYVKGTPGKSVSFSDAVSEILARGKSVLGRGLYDPPTEKSDPILGGNSSPNYTFGAQVAEVEVDMETGQVEVVAMTVAQDVGFAINPMGAEGQLEGSLSNGLGQARWEDLVRRDGAILNPSFLDYKMPTALDMSRMTTILVESMDPEGPYGAKGMGEGGLVPTVPTVVNAFSDAVGVRLTGLPLAPERILDALNNRAAGDGLGRS